MVSGEQSRKCAGLWFSAASADLCGLLESFRSSSFSSLSWTELGERWTPQGGQGIQERSGALDADTVGDLLTSWASVFPHLKLRILTRGLVVKGAARVCVGSRSTGGGL